MAAPNLFCFFALDDPYLAQHVPAVHLGGVPLLTTVFARFRKKTISVSGDSKESPKRGCATLCWELLQHKNDYCMCVCGIVKELSAAAAAAAVWNYSDVFG